VTELYAHLLPDHLARARNAVNLGPTLQTVATTVARGTETANFQRKTHTRHYFSGRVLLIHFTAAK
jgi:hypothetical protein